MGLYDDIKETWMISTMGGCAQTLVDEMESAKLMTESLAEFEAVDCSQMQFDYLLICINFNKHYKDETLKGAIVDYCFELQAKFQKYEIRFSANYPIPNLTEITKAPCDWKDLIEEQQEW